MITKPTKLYCHKAAKHGGGEYLAHFHGHPRTVALYFEKPEPIFVVLVSEGIEEQNGIQYWAWWNEKDQVFEMVYPSKGVVNMCFPYGAKAEEECGRGKLLPVVKIQILESCL